MPIEKLQAGETIPIALNAFDAAENLFPQAIIRDANNVVLATVDLSHIGDGLYVNYTIPYPSTTPIISVLYKVYSDAGHTVIDQNYQDMLDVFLRDIPAFVPSSVHFVERIKARIAKRDIRIKTRVDRIVAKIAKPKIKIVLKQVRIQAKLVQPKIKIKLYEV